MYILGWFVCYGGVGTGTTSFNGAPAPVVGDINGHIVTRIYTGANTSFAITGINNNNNNIHTITTL